MLFHVFSCFFMFLTYWSDMLITFRCPCDKLNIVNCNSTYQNTYNHVIWIRTHRVMIICRLQISDVFQIRPKQLPDGRKHVTDQRNNVFWKKKHKTLFWQKKILGSICWLVELLRTIFRFYEKKSIISTKPKYM